MSLYGYDVDTKFFMNTVHEIRFHSTEVYRIQTE